MYGSINECDTRGNQVRNEISIQNLIEIATNPELFNALDEKTKTELKHLIAVYTRECIDAIKNSDVVEDVGIRKQM